MPITKEQAQAILEEMSQGQKSETIKSIAALLNENNPNRELLKTLANSNATPLELLNATCMSLIMNNGDTFEKNLPVTSKLGKLVKAAGEFKGAAKNRVVANIPSEIDQLNETCKTIQENLILMAYRAKPDWYERKRRGETPDQKKYRELLVKYYPLTNSDNKEYWAAVEGQMKKQNSGLYNAIFNAAVNEISRGRQEAIEPMLESIKQAETESADSVNQLVQSMISTANDIKIGTSWTTQNPKLREDRQALLKEIKNSLNSHTRTATFHAETRLKISRLITLEEETMKDSTFVSKSRHQNNINKLNKILTSLDAVKPLEEHATECTNAINDIDGQISEAKVREGLSGNIETTTEAAKKAAIEATKKAAKTKYSAKSDPTIIKLSKKYASIFENTNATPTKRGEGDRRPPLTDAKDAQKGHESLSILDRGESTSVNRANLKKCDFTYPDQRKETIKELCEIKRGTGEDGLADELEENKDDMIRLFKEIDLSDFNRSYEFNNIVNAIGAFDEKVHKTLLPKLIEIYSSVDLDTKSGFNAPVVRKDIADLMFGKDGRYQNAAIKELINHRDILPESAKSDLNVFCILHNENSHNQWPLSTQNLEALQSIKQTPSQKRSM